MTAEMTNNNFFPYWFHASIFFFFSRVITSHLQTFGSTLVVGKALDKVNMVYDLCLFIRHILGVNTELNMFN